MTKKTDKPSKDIELESPKDEKFLLLSPTGEKTLPRRNMLFRGLSKVGVDIVDSEECCKCVIS